MNIKHLISISKLSQDALGAEIGLKKGIVNTYITGKAKPKIDTLVKISEYFSISIDDLLKKDLTQNSLSDSSSGKETTNTQEGEEMNEGLFAVQMQQLIEMNRQHMEMNMKLVAMLQTSNQQTNYGTILGEIKQALELIPQQRPQYIGELEQVKKNQELMQQHMNSTDEKLSKLIDIVLENKKKKKD